MNKHFSVAVLFSLFIPTLSATLSWAAPAQVVILRHAEKPETGNDLTAQGYERANALPGLFSSDPALTRYGTPAAIYAMNPNDGEALNRAIETVTPLAKALNLPLQESFAKTDLTSLVSAVVNNSDYDGKTVVICWVHSEIPTLVQDFGYADAPATWPKDAFDRLWILHFDGNKVTGFEDLPQDLLPGDSKT